MPYLFYFLLGIQIYDAIDDHEERITALESGGTVTINESKFISICQAGKQADLAYGTIITLDNSYQVYWEVIGKNHDGTTNTVDIMSHTIIDYPSYFGTSSNIYSGSILHTFCNETIPNAFNNATTKSLIKTMDVASNGSTLTGQKGKALSCTEVGFNSSVIEGTGYGLSSYWREGRNNAIWTRTCYYNQTDYVSVIRSTGSMGLEMYDGSSYNTGSCPVLRF